MCTRYAGGSSHSRSLSCPRGSSFVCVVTHIKNQTRRRNPGLPETNTVIRWFLFVAKLSFSTSEAILVLKSSPVFLWKNKSILSTGRKDAECYLVPEFLLPVFFFKQIFWIIDVFLSWCSSSACSLMHRGICWWDGRCFWATSFYSNAAQLEKEKEREREKYG